MTASQCGVSTRAGEASTSRCGGGGAAFLSDFPLGQRRPVLLPVFVNSVLLEHSHAHSFPYPLLSLSHHNSPDE